MGKYSKGSGKAQQKKNSNAKANVFLGLKALVSNQACVDLGHDKPWYSAIIVFLLSVILCVLPTFVNTMRVQGSAVLSSPTYGFQMGASHFQEDLLEYDLGEDKMYVSENRLTLSSSDWVTFVDQVNTENGSGTYNHWYRHYDETTNALDFQVFYCDDEAAFSSYVTNIYNKVIPNLEADRSMNNTYLEPTDSTHDANIGSVHTVIFGPTQFRIFKFNSAGTMTSGGTAITWKYLGNSLPMFAGNTAPVEADYQTEIAYAEAYDTYLSNTLSAWCSFLDASYRDYRTVSAWTQTGIMAAIYVVFIAFMGFLIWLMCRGKNNPFRIYNLWHTQKMSYWAAFTPALLHMIIVFIAGNSSIFAYAFIFLHGIRIMWMAMRTLRPQR